MTRKPYNFWILRVFNSFKTNFFDMISWTTVNNKFFSSDEKSSSDLDENECREDVQVFTGLGTFEEAVKTISMLLIPELHSLVINVIIFLCFWENLTLQDTIFPEFKFHVAPHFCPFSSVSVMALRIDRTEGAGNTSGRACHINSITRNGLWSRYFK